MQIKNKLDIELLILAIEIIQKLITNFELVESKARFSLSPNWREK